MATVGRTHQSSNLNHGMLVDGPSVKVLLLEISSHTICTCACMHMHEIESLTQK